jgi:hypothetical protein
MSADNGFRYGTTAKTWPKGGDWVHVLGDHASYAEIRKDQHRLDKVDNALITLERRLEKATDLVRYLRALLLGGHVRRDKLAIVQAQIKRTDDPESAIKSIAERVDAAGLN